MRGCHYCVERGSGFGRARLSHGLRPDALSEPALCLNLLLRPVAQTHCGCLPTISTLPSGSTGLCSSLLSTVALLPSPTLHLEFRRKAPLSGREGGHQGGRGPMMGRQRQGRESKREYAGFPADIPWSSKRKNHFLKFNAYK